jgi:hypothetical protein
MNGSVSVITRYRDETISFCDVCLLRLIDLTTRHRKECELETERLCSAQQQAERLLEARERAHRQQIKGLEEQVSSKLYTCSFLQEVFLVRKVSFITYNARSALLMSSVSVNVG